MDSLILKNSSTTASLQINDLGVDLGPGEVTNLISNFRDEDLLESTDLPGAMAGTAQVTLNTVALTYADLVAYLTRLSKYDKIDYAYITSKDTHTDVTSSELERLTDGSDVSTTPMLHNHDSVYYTKDQLSNANPSTVSVDWQNIKNSPAFGSLQWKDPVDRSNSGYGAGVALPLSGNLVNDARMVKDDGDGKPAQYVCVAVTGLWSDQWKKIADIDWGNASGIGITAAGNLTSTNVQSAIYELQSDIDDIVDGTLDIQHSLNDSYIDGNSISVNGAELDFDLTDTKSFAVRSDSGATNIIKVTADATGDTVAIKGALTLTGVATIDGASFSIDSTSASNVSVTGGALTLSTINSGNVVITAADSLLLKDKYLLAGIPLSQSGVTGLDGFTSSSIVGALNELKNTDVATTLQQAYDGSVGSGAGRVINADSGAVKITGTNGYAPLELVPSTVAPTAGLAAGQMTFINNELFAYDSTRTKWLSVAVVTDVYTLKSANGQYLQIGDAIGTASGHKLSQNATLVRIVANTLDGQPDKALDIRKNSTTTALKTFNLSSGAYTSTTDNIDFAAGDVVQVFVHGTGDPLKSPNVTLYFKWRA